MTLSGVTPHLLGRRLYFTPPTYEMPFGVVTGLYRFFTFPKGIAVLVSGTTVTENKYPFQGDLESYDYVYLGGYSHPITDAEATILTNAGYGAYITA